MKRVSTIVAETTMNENTCRLCLRVQTRLTSIFCDNEASERLRSRIMDCCPVTLFEDDRLPKAVCEQCRKKLAIAYEFRERCRKSELALRSRYESSYWKESTGSEKRALVRDRAVQTERVDSNEVEAKEKETSSREEETEDGTKEGESEQVRVESWTRFELNEGTRPDEINDETRIDRTNRSSKEQEIIHTESKLVENCEANERVVAEKRYLCDVCSKTFVSKSGLRFHLKSHNGAKPYQCGHCGKGFAIPSYVKRHERIHAGEKRFVCHVCSATFASSNGLKYHLRSHTGEANYRCEICGKCFYRRKYLIEHGYTHTGERPFVCRTCGSCYGNSGSLFVHEKRCKTRGTDGESQRRRR